MCVRSFTCARLRSNILSNSILKEFILQFILFYIRNLLFLLLLLVLLFCSTLYMFTFKSIKKNCFCFIIFCLIVIFKINNKKKNLNINKKKNNISKTFNIKLTILHFIHNYVPFCVVVVFVHIEITAYYNY